MATTKKQVIGYDEMSWELLGGRGRRMPDFCSADFVATMDLQRVWTVTPIDPEHRGPDSASVWWDDHCDDERRKLVRGKLPFHAIAGPRNQAALMLWKVQRAYDMWKQCGCPMEDAA